MAPPKVFLAGSRRISRLPVEVKRRIDAMIDGEFRILVGDAAGADKAVQGYLADRAYRNVVVHCMEKSCRNNVGHWPARRVAAPPGTRGFDYYSIKDRVMADTAEYGLMLWDGKSKGTINNIVNLLRRQRPAVVYLAPTRNFDTVRTLERSKGDSREGRPQVRRPAGKRTSSGR